jgi:hypothetical protein
MLLLQSLSSFQSSEDWRKTVHPTIRASTVHKNQSSLFSQAIASYNSFRFSRAHKNFFLFATRPFLLSVICGRSVISFAQVSCASGASSWSPLMRASCKPFESPSTSSSSTALTVLSTKRLNGTGKGMIIIFIWRENRGTCLGSMLAHLP